MVAVLAGGGGRHGLVVVRPLIFGLVPVVARRGDRLGLGARIILPVDGYLRRVGAHARLGAGRLGGDFIRHGHLQIALRFLMVRVVLAGRRRRRRVVVVPHERHIPIVAQRGKRHFLGSRDRRLAVDSHAGYPGLLTTLLTGGSNVFSRVLLDCSSLGFSRATVVSLAGALHMSGSAIPVEAIPFDFAPCTPIVAQHGNVLDILGYRSKCFVREGSGVGRRALVRAGRSRCDLRCDHYRLMLFRGAVFMCTGPRGRRRLWIAYEVEITADIAPGMILHRPGD